MAIGDASFVRKLLPSGVDVMRGVAVLRGVGDAVRVGVRVGVFVTVGVADGCRALLTVRTVGAAAMLANVIRHSAMYTATTI